MIKHSNQKIRNLFFISLLGTGLFILPLLNCSLLSQKTPPLNSKNLNFKIRWDYSSPFKESSETFDSLVSIQGDKLLRLDILQPFVGVVGVLTLNDKTIILQEPFGKRYYKGKANSKIFFPDFPSFPGIWLTALLRAKALKAWKCRWQKERLVFCRAGVFKIQWEYKHSRIYKIHIRDSKQRQISARIKNIASSHLPLGIFEPSLEGWRQMRDPLFFKNF